MSLVRIAVRVAAVQALKDRTLAGSNVKDSEIGAIESNADGSFTIGETAPFIAVYSDGSTSQGSDVSLRSLSLNGSTDLIFETGVTAAMVERNEDLEAVLLGIGIPDVDGAMEFQLDLIVRQIMVALTDPNNEWAQILLSLTRGFTACQRGRVSSNADGIRRAAQQIKIKVELVADPVWGNALITQSPLSMFLSKCEESGDLNLVKVAELMRANIGEDDSDQGINQRRYGLTFDEMQAMLLLN